MFQMKTKRSLLIFFLLIIVCSIVTISLTACSAMNSLSSTKNSIAKSQIAPVHLLSQSETVVAAAAPPALAASASNVGPIFLNISTISGGSPVKGRTGWIDIVSFSNGFNFSASSSTGGGGGKVTPEAFSVTKVLDKSSPKLFNSCCTGKNIGNVTLDLVNSNGQTYMEYKLANAMVSSIKPSGSTTTQPVEVVTFTYSQITWTYTDYSTSPPQVTTNSWNVLTNIGS